jgi:hypothetical protein
MGQVQNFRKEGKVVLRPYKRRLQGYMKKVSRLKKRYRKNHRP